PLWRGPLRNQDSDRRVEQPPKIFWRTLLGSRRARALRLAILAGFWESFRHVQLPSMALVDHEFFVEQSVLHADHARDVFCELLGALGVDQMTAAMNEVDEDAGQLFASHSTVAL